MGLMIHSLSQTSVQRHPSPAQIDLSCLVMSYLIFEKDKNEIFISSSVFHYISFTLVYL